MATRRSSPIAESWRSRLSRRLLAITAVLTALVYLPISLATGTGAVRLVLFSAGLVIIVALAAVARARSERLRSLIVVATFGFIGIVGYLTVGSLSGPGIGFAAAVVFGGLLLGRRAMYLSVAVVAVSSASIAGLMVSGRIPAPDAATVAFDQAAPWVRSSVITLILVVILASAMVGVVETLEEATRRTDEEIERRRNLERVMARDEGVRAAGRLAAGLAHDVRNQLAAVRNWNELDDDRAVARPAIDEAVGHALDLTNRLLALGGPGSRSGSSSSVAQVLDDNRDLLGFLKSQQIELSLDADDATWCSLDDHQIGQLVVNLVMNACQAIEGQGHVAVHARTARRRDGLGLDAAASTEWVQIEVSDDGPGMSPETAARSVEPYFTTKDATESSGLGLATVAAIVEGAGGAVAIDTTLDVGTTVTLWLPVAPPPTVLDLDIQASSETADWSG